MDPALRCKDEQEINECLRTEQHECLAVANSLVKCSTGPVQYEVGSIIDNTGIIIIGGDGHHIYQQVVARPGLETVDPCYTSLDDQERRLNSHDQQLDNNRAEMNGLAEQIEQQNIKLQRLDEHIALLHQTQLPTIQHFSLHDVAVLQNLLIKQFEGATRCVQVMPLDDEEGLPLSELYGSVLIEQDVAVMKRIRRHDELHGTCSKSLDSITEVFYVKDKLAQRIILHGEAGHGKTVFCLKVLECWSRAKHICREVEAFNTCLTDYVETTKIEGLRGSSFQRSSVEKVNRTGTCKGFKQGNFQSKVNKLGGSMSSAPTEERDESELQSCVSQFELVFYVPLRHAKHGLSSIADLVCDSVSSCDQNTKQKIKEILGDNSISCLVLLDGLDEWRGSDTCRVQGFPDRDGLLNCTVLCTMRPWKLVNLQLGLDSTCDKVVHILGLKGDSIETVISNVLVHFYGLQLTSSVYKERFRYFCEKAKIPLLKSLMKIPLVLTSSCLVWNEECESSGKKYVNYSASYFMTFFCLKQIEITITRAEMKHDAVKSFLRAKRENSCSSLKISGILAVFDYVIDFFEVIKSIGRLALQDLVSEEPRLVFPRHKLEREIGQHKVELALKVGILSQAKAPGLSFQQRVSVSFYHKTMQEFLAALVIAFGDLSAYTLFCRNCNTADKIMELSNVIMFVCGLDPVVGCRLSEHVKNVVNGDADINRYREPQVLKHDKSMCTGKVRQLYQMQCRWFSEMKHNMSYTGNTEGKLSFHVSDVSIDRYYNSDRDVVSMTSELMCMEGSSVVSVYLWYVRHPVQSILQHLLDCKYISTLFTSGITDERERELLIQVLPQLVLLQHLSYGYSDDNLQHPPRDTAVVRATRQLPTLKWIELRRITLTETVYLAPSLETVVLSTVRHVEFILPSICQCRKMKCLKLSEINLADTVAMTHMTQLETVVLGNVRPAHLILPSLYQCIQLKYIVLENLELIDTVALPPLVEEAGLHKICPARFILPSLSSCVHLTSLEISGLENREDCDILTNLLPCFVHLKRIRYGNCKMGDAGATTVVCSLNRLKHLRHIQLEIIHLCDGVRPLCIPHTTQIEKIDFWQVRMSAKGWAELVSSLLSVHHTVHVSLERTDIDVDTVTTIQKSPHFTVSHYKDWLRSNPHEIDVTFSTL